MFFPDLFTTASYKQPPVETCEPKRGRLINGVIRHKGDTILDATPPASPMKANRPSFCVDEAHVDRLASHQMASASHSSLDSLQGRRQTSVESHVYRLAWPIIVKNKRRRLRRTRARIARRPSFLSGLGLSEDEQCDNQAVERCTAPEPAAAPDTVVTQYENHSEVHYGESITAAPDASCTPEGTDVTEIVHDQVAIAKQTIMQTCDVVKEVATPAETSQDSEMTCHESPRVHAGPAGLHSWPSSSSDNDSQLDNAVSHNSTGLRPTAASGQLDLLLHVSTEHGVCQKVIGNAISGCHAVSPESPSSPLQHDVFMTE
eukprot:jgi/Chrzof1/1569/Cz10g12230.t1